MTHSGIIWLVLEREKHERLPREEAENSNFISTNGCFDCFKVARRSAFDCSNDVIVTFSFAGMTLNETFSSARGLSDFFHCHCVLVRLHTVTVIFRWGIGVIMGSD